MLTTQQISDLELKRELHKALAEKQKRVREFGLRYYQPHYKQDLFHLAGNRKRRYMRTGNRFGKSDMGAAEACAWALGYRPWYEMTFDVVDGKGNKVRQHEGKPNHPDCFKGIPKRATKGLIICHDWDKAEEIFTSEEDGLGRGKLFKFLPDRRGRDDGETPGIIRVKRTSTGAISLLYVRSIHGGVSTIYLDTVRSYKTDGMGQESSNWDWIQIDEPCPEGMWKACSRGLIDANGSAWFNCTPLRERWINDMFIPGHRTPLKQDQENIFQVKGSDRWVMVGSMHDNPHLQEAAKREFISSLTDDEIKTRVDGQPAHLSGVIYTQFDYGRHVYTDNPRGWEQMNKPPRTYKVRYSIDPHPQTPHAVLFAATAPTGQVFLFSEIFDHCLTGDLIKQIYDVIGDQVVDSVPCDWMAFEENPIDGRCMADEFDEHGIQVHKSPRQLSAGIIAVKAALARPNFIYVSEHLERFLYEIDSYVWDEKKEKPADGKDHMMENFYRLVLEGLDYEMPSFMKPDSKRTIAPTSDDEVYGASMDLPGLESSPLDDPWPTEKFQRM